MKYFSMPFWLAVWLAMMFSSSTLLMMNSANAKHHHHHMMKHEVKKDVKHDMMKKEDMGKKHGDAPAGMETDHK